MMVFILFQHFHKMNTTNPIVHTSNNTVRIPKIINSTSVKLRGLAELSGPALVSGEVCCVIDPVLVAVEIEIEISHDKLFDIIII